MLFVDMVYWCQCFTLFRFNTFEIASRRWQFGMVCHGIMCILYWTFVLHFLSAIKFSSNPHKIHFFKQKCSQKVLEHNSEDEKSATAFCNSNSVGAINQYQDPPGRTKLALSLFLSFPFLFIVSRIARLNCPITQLHTKCFPI